MAHRDFKKEYLAYQDSMDGDCMGYESWLEGKLRSFSPKEEVMDNDNVISKRDVKSYLKIQRMLNSILEQSKVELFKTVDKFKQGE